MTDTAGEIWTAYAVFVLLLVAVALGSRRGGEIQRRAVTLVVLSTWLCLACAIGPAGWTAALITLWVLFVLEHLDPDQLGRKLVVAAWGFGPLVLIWARFTGPWMWVLSAVFAAFAVSVLLPLTPVRSGIYRLAFLAGFALPALIAWRALGDRSPAWPRPVP